MKVTMTGYEECFRDMSGKINRMHDTLPEKWASEASKSYMRAYYSLMGNFYSSYTPRVYKRTFKLWNAGRERNSRNKDIGGLTVASVYMHGDYFDRFGKKSATAEFVLNQVWNNQIRYHHPITHVAIPFDARIDSYIGLFSGGSPHALMEQYQDAYYKRMVDAQCNTDITHELDS